MKTYKNHSLLSHNTFHMDVRAAEFIHVEKEIDYTKLNEYIGLKTKPILILGEGSNILFTKNFPGLVIKSDISNIEIIHKNEHYTWVKASAGNNWHQFVSSTIKMGLFGLENLSLIPGSVGAAPVQNIGAYGVELDQLIDHVDIIKISSGIEKSFTNKDCEFSYRSSVFKSKLKDKALIKSVTFKLYNQPQFNTSYGEVEAVLKRMGVKKLSADAISKAIIEIRRSKLPDPAMLGNAGSFFKNPILDTSSFLKLKEKYPELPYYEFEGKFKIPAAWLIDQCGWKGKRVGNAGVHQKQPLVLVNYGGAIGTDILHLATQIQESIEVKFGIKIIPEVNII